ncbi:MAG: MarR family transcriptional regulator [Pyrinomonadaceae bacterium]|nr:MarR family transcriptional regulator [Pyrinomonadaceae bacterium]
MTESVPTQVEKVLNNFADFVSRLMVDQYQQHLAELALTLPQAQVLRILKGGALLTGQLADELRISAPAMTQLTDRLIRKGLIERRAADDDRRCVIVALSTEGARLIDQFRERRQDVFHGALSNLSEGDRRQVGEALEKVIGALESYHGGAVNESVADFRPRRREQ